MGHWKRELAHMLVDAGAHIYVAHGDPRLQGHLRVQCTAMQVTQPAWSEAATSHADPHDSFFLCTHACAGIEIYRGCPIFYCENHATAMHSAESPCYFSCVDNQSC